jgi:hypothetical protein
VRFLANLSRVQKIALSSIVAVVVLAGGAVALTGGGDSEAQPSSTTAAPTTQPPTTTTAAPAAIAPLTGLPQSDPAKLSRPAVIVKIDNDNRKARPQVGLNNADVVYEEIVEGGVTRFAAVFQSSDSDPVGPIRSARTTDLQLVANLNRPLLAWSGANKTVAGIVRGGPLVDLGFDASPGIYFRDRGRPAPSNLFTRTTDVFAHAPAGSAAPAPLFQYRKSGEAVPGVANSHVALAYGGKINLGVDWRWDGKVWKRDQAGTAHLDSTGQHVNAANVVIQFVDYKSSGFVDVTGADSPEAVLTGSGEVWVFTAGKVITGRWSRPSIQASTSYTDTAGQPIKLTPGRTWVLLPRPGSARLAG